MEAACQLKKEGGDPRVEIMIPLVSLVSELDTLRKESEEVIGEVLAKCGVEVDYKIGTMIEVPRAAVTADEIAKVADFFSPYRVPLARLAAAQAVLGEGKSSTK